MRSQPALCIASRRDAIEGFLRLSPDRAAALTDDDRREFVRTHLGQIVAAAKAQLQSIDPASDSIVIGAVQSPAAETSGDRRRGSDRRKGDRRKVNRPVPRERRSGGDRRKS